MLEKLAKAIKEFEGWKVGKTILGKRIGGSVSWNNCNEGNMRSSPFQIGTRGGFAVFSSEDAGHHALIYQLTLVCTGKSPVYSSRARTLGIRDSSLLTLIQFFEIYAPAGDSNQPRHYAETVAGKCGIYTTTQMYQILKLQ